MPLCVSIPLTIMNLKAKIFLPSLLICQCLGHDCEKERKDLVFEDNYNLANPPKSPNSTETPISVRLLFKSIQHVDDSMKTLTFSSLIYVEWVEHRIRMANLDFSMIRKSRDFNACI